MSLNFTYPVAAEIKQIAADISEREMASRVGLQLFPVETSPTHNVRWTQLDNYYGLQQLRGLDGNPSYVQRLGESTFVYEPGVYGEFVQMTEEEATRRASAFGSNTPIRIEDWVAANTKLLVVRELDRMENNIWTLLATGTISVAVPGATGTKVYTDTYPIQTFAAGVAWSSASNATPILDMQAMQQKWVGHGVSFGPDSTLWINQVQANRLVNNTNSSDLGGRKLNFGQTTNSIALINGFFAAQGLPQVRVYDQGYQTNPLPGPEVNSSQFTKFIANGTGILVGARPAGQPVGAFMQTRQIVTGGSGPYTLIKDWFNGTNAPRDIPGKIQLHRGFNGGPVVYYPSAVVACTL